MPNCTHTRALLAQRPSQSNPLTACARTKNAQFCAKARDAGRTVSHLGSSSDCAAPPPRWTLGVADNDAAGASRALAAVRMLLTPNAAANAPVRRLGCIYAPMAIRLRASAIISRRSLAARHRPALYRLLPPPPWPESPPAPPQAASPTPGPPWPDQGPFRPFRRILHRILHRSNRVHSVSALNCSHLRHAVRILQGPVPLGGTEQVSRRQLSSRARAAAPGKVPAAESARPLTCAFRAADRQGVEVYPPIVLVLAGAHRVWSIMTGLFSRGGGPVGRRRLHQARWSRRCRDA